MFMERNYLIRIWNEKKIVLILKQIATLNEDKNKIILILKIEEIKNLKIVLLSFDNEK